MSTRDRLLLGVAVIALAVAGFWFLLLAPKRDELRKLNTAVAKKQDAVNSASASLSQALAAKRDYSAAYATVARLGEAVPSDDNVPSLIYQVNHAAAGSGVDFRQLQLSAQTGTTATASSSSSTSASGSGGASALPPGAAVGPAGFPTMPFTLAFEGDFFHMAKFMRNLQRFVVLEGKTVRVHGRLLTLDAISITAARTGFPKIRATVSATAFLLPPGQGSQAGGSSTGSAGGTASPPGTPPSSSSSSGAGSTAAATATPAVR